MSGGGRGPAGRVHCRHCLRPFRRGRIGVVCRSQRCRGVLDETGARRPRFFHADDAGLWRDDRLPLDEVACPACGVRDELESVCPHCRQPLGLDQGEDQVLAVIGASDSGKSHFLAAVLHQLLDGGAGDGVWRVDLPDSELRPFRERYLEPLFEQLRVIPPHARADRPDEELRLPLVNVHDGRRVLLVFRDLSGETFLDPRALARLNFLRYAGGVVLMADPRAFEPPTAGAAGDEVVPWDRNRQPDALAILDVYRRVLEQRERRADDGALPLRPADKVLAVAVTKADLVLPPEHPFWHPGNGGDPARPGYWERRREAGAAVARWVAEWLSPRLVRETAAFADVGWFFTSSIGYRLPPGRRELPEPPRPRRVHEPIFALLDRLTGGGAGDLAVAAAAPGAAPHPPRPRRRTEDEDWGL